MTIAVVAAEAVAIVVMISRCPDCLADIDGLTIIPRAVHAAELLCIACSTTDAVAVIVFETVFRFLFKPSELEARASAMTSCMLSELSTLNTARGVHEAMAVLLLRTTMTISHKSSDDDCNTTTRETSAAVCVCTLSHQQQQHAK